MALLGLLGVAACFSAREDGTRELPFDPRDRRAPARRSGSSGWTGTRSGWCRGTPTRCARCAASGSTRAPATTSTWTWARWRSATRWREVGVADDVIRFELFDATHAAIDYRYPMSLAWLCTRIAG